jgi:xanthine dehydrogenase accessory factor
VEVLLERAGATGQIDPLALADDCMRNQRRGAVATVFRSSVASVPIGSRIAILEGKDPFGDGTIADAPIRQQLVRDVCVALANGQSSVRSYASGAVEVLVEALVPPPRLFVFGTGHDAVPVAQLARSLGWDVSVCTPKPRLATRERFPHADEVLVGSAAELAERIKLCDRAVAVVMNHNYEVDREHLGVLVTTPVRYIGMLGPRARTERMLGELCLSLDDARIHAPIGLPLGAETPQEIALAIVAEIQAVLTDAPCLMLRDLPGPIHARDGQRPIAAKPSSSRPTLPLAVAV